MEKQAIRTAVLCVVYGSTEVPHILVELSQRDGVETVVVDNSGTLESMEPAGVNILEPGHNMGYPRAINLGLSALRGPFDVLVIINPDVEGDAAELLAFAAEVARYPVPVLASPGGRTADFGLRSRQDLFGAILQHVFRTGTRFNSKRHPFLSGALVAMSAKLVACLAPDGQLLREDLFFMDDVDLSDRAVAAGAVLREFPGCRSIRHVGGVSMATRPSVRIYFTRVSKVRYWGSHHALKGLLLRAFFVVESSLGILLSGRRGSARPGASVRDGFVSVVRWSLTGDGRIDAYVLGNDR